MAEVIVYLKDELTWGEVTREADIGVHKILALM